MTSIAESVSTTSSASNMQVLRTGTLQPRLARAERSDVVGHSGVLPRDIISRRTRSSRALSLGNPAPTVGAVWRGASTEPGGHVGFTGRRVTRCGCGCGSEALAQALGDRLDCGGERPLKRESSASRHHHLASFFSPHTHPFPSPFRLYYSSHAALLTTRRFSSCGCCQRAEVISTPAPHDRQ